MIGHLTTTMARLMIGVLVLALLVTLSSSNEPDHQRNSRSLSDLDTNNLQGENCLLL